MLSWLKKKKTEPTTPLSSYEFQYEKRGLVVMLSNGIAEVHETKLLLDNLVEESFCHTDGVLKWVFSWSDLYDLMQLPDFLDIIIEMILDEMYEQVGDVSDGYLDDFSKEDKDKLNDMINDFISEKYPARFYRIDDTELIENE